MRSKIIIAASAVIIIIIAVILLTILSPIDPVSYHPPRKPAMTGVLSPNSLLDNVNIIAAGKVDGPEDLAFDKQGRLYTGTADGAIIRITTDGAAEAFAKTGGRVLGLRFDPLGNLIVCDAYQGLLSIDKNGSITTLATAAEGVKFKTTDALDISRDGTIYFTDGSDKFFLDDFLLDMMEARPHGRFMRFDPATKKVTVLLRGLCFANGVALSQNEEFVLINDTFRYRVMRYWLKGPKAGTSDIFIENLPGMPDNISSNGAGTFWLALFTTRNDVLDLVHRFPLIKKLAGSLPHFLWARSAKHGFVVSLDERGKITGSLQDSDGSTLYNITSAVEHGGHLYLGSLTADRIGRYRLER
ncbi:MAG: SMP-30/gluconolactonase/LRE family protein [Spirochaetes bacterium]|nr:SMP-30/gluconolactonase/LRE family protein [Spirochaetota bacterium]